MKYLLILIYLIRDKSMEVLYLSDNDEDFQDAEEEELLDILKQRQDAELL